MATPPRLSLLLSALTVLACADRRPAPGDHDSADEAIDRKSGQLGRCIGPSRIDAGRVATLVHADAGTPPVVAGAELTLQDEDGPPGGATLQVAEVDSSWVSDSWNIFSASGTFVDSRRGAAQEGTFNLVVGPAVGVLLLETDDGEPWDFYRMGCDSDGEPEAVSDPPVATRWSLKSRSNDLEMILRSEVLLPGPGDELVLAGEDSDSAPAARLDVTASAAMPFASFVSGRFVDDRSGTRVRGTFELVVGTDINILLMRTDDGQMWDFLGGTAEPDPRTVVAADAVAHCVVVAADGTFGSARPPRRGDRLALDLAQLDQIDALRFNGERPDDPEIPLNGALAVIEVTDGVGIRLESPPPGRVDDGLGVDILTHGPGRLSTMWLAQNLINTAPPADVSLALLQCASEPVHTVPSPPPTRAADRCLTGAIDGRFVRLPAGDVALAVGDALDVAPDELADLPGTQTVSFRTRAGGVETVTFAQPLEFRGSDDTGLRLFAPGDAQAGGVHIDLFAGESLWVYHNVAAAAPLADATWLTARCPR